MVRRSYLQVVPCVLLTFVQFVPNIGLILQRSLLIVEEILWLLRSLLQIKALGQV